MEKYLKVVCNLEKAQELKAQFPGRIVRDGYAIALDELSKEHAPLPEGSIYWELWERGGGFTNTGSAAIIAGPDGEALRPTYIARGYACEKHAMFRVYPAQCVYIVCADRNRNGDRVFIYKFLPTGSDSKPTEIFNGSAEELHQDLEFLRKAVVAVLEKVHCYHCRHVHYFVAKEESN